MIDVVINGQDRRIEPPGTVRALLEAFRLKPEMVIVERNGEIVPRARYESEPVEARDRLELVQMTAGG
ncbi:MAG TPA: sulfur carrier protein ThiS [Armatimonadota bacterium]|nr:sulfur carrier protein ThiS [Armatimonadota bacterium]